jgi:hypothetical protein
MTTTQEIFGCHRVSWPMPATGLRDRVRGQQLSAAKPHCGAQPITVRVAKEQE